MFPEDILNFIFENTTIQQFDIYTQSTIIHAIEKAIYENGFEIIKSDLGGQIQE